MRTNVKVDDHLVSEVMSRYRLRTKSEAVDLALRRLVGETLGPTEALALEGSSWEADLGELRRSRTIPTGGPIPMPPVVGDPDSSAAAAVSELRD